MTVRRVFYRGTDETPEVVLSQGFQAVDTVELGEGGGFDACGERAVRGVFLTPHADVAALYGLYIYSVKPPFPTRVRELEGGDFIYPDSIPANRITYYGSWEDM